MMGQRERDALDRHITGNYGEDQFADYYEGPEMDPAEAAAYDAWEAEQLAIHEGRATQLTHCYLCFADQTGTVDTSPKQDQGPLRGEGKTKTIAQNFDPTTAVQLIPCGHWII